ncbi:MAG: PIN domain-containing protein [Marinilabiliales bacterium]|nr:PIN domain-containing protein [Marinilabiliales bacterium]
MHDYTCIYNFEENDVVIPIVVLEELDKFKRGNDMINFHAREFTRELDKIAGRHASHGQHPSGREAGNPAYRDRQTVLGTCLRVFPGKNSGPPHTGHCRLCDQCRTRTRLSCSSPRTST